MIVLELAREWGIPPWQIEQEATDEWVQRWMAERVARGAAQNQTPPKPGMRRLT